MVCLTNIPTPYRLHLFHVLFTELQARGWELEVWFMAKSEPGRYWKFKDEDFRFHHRFLRGVHFNCANVTFHFNPGVVLSLIKNPPEILLIAGAWGLPTNILTTVQAKIFRGPLLLFWSESHLGSSRRKGWLIDKSRNLLLRLYDGFAVPGRAAAEYVQHYSPDTPLYEFPNTVEERVFRDKVRICRLRKEQLRKTFSIPEQKRILLLPARLIIEKGIIPFLTATASLSFSVSGRFTLLIAGDGPLREVISDWIARHPALDIRLLGHLSADEMVKLYAVADSFILPSLSDPNPLSVIEALWAGLPLLLSDRVGNHPEVLVSEGNGWLFNPNCASEIHEVLEKWVATSDQGLKLRSSYSIKIAEERFTTTTIVRQFLSQLLEQTGKEPASATEKA